MLKNPLNNKPSHLLETIGWILLSAYVMVLPIGHTVALRNLLFFSLIAITIWLALRSRIQISVPIVKPWLLYAAIAFISLTYAIDPWYSLGEIKTEIGFGFMAMVLGATWVRTPAQLSRLMWVVIACNVFLVAGSLYYALPVLAQTNMPLIGSFNIGIGKLSTYIIMALPFIAAQWAQLPERHRGFKRLLLGLIVGNIVSLYFTGNRAGLVALIVEIAVLATLLLKYHILSHTGKRMAAFLPLFILLLAAVSLGILEIKQMGNRASSATTDISAAISADARWEVWGFAAKNIQSRPLTGGGFGLHAFKLLNPRYQKDNPKHNTQLWHAHNTLLNIGVQMGLPGMIAFIILIATALLQVSVPLRKTHGQRKVLVYSATTIIMFVGLAIKLQTDDYFNRDIALFFWLIVGALTFTMANPNTEIQY